MQPSIPASDIVNILPAALGTGGTSLSLNTVTFSTVAKVPVKEYFDKDTVGDDFGVTSNAYKWAEIYFNGFTNSSIKPSSLFIAEYATADKAGTLVGRSLRSVTLDELKAINGTLSVTIDGTLKTGSVDLTAATSFSNAATIIATALTAAVTFDTQLQAFVVASGTTGATSSISYATGTASFGLGLSQDGGATLNNVTVADIPETAMERVTSYTLNFAPISNLEESAFDIDFQKAISQWVSKQNHRFWYIGYGKEPTALIPNNDTCFGAWVAANNIQDITPLYGDQSHASFLCGSIASISFEELNGRVTMDFRNQAGVVAAVTNKADSSALKSNGYAFYGAWATANDRFQFLRNSVVSGEFKWADTYAFQLWMNSNFELDGMVGLQQFKAVPYNSTGKALYRSMFQDTINQGINFGGIVSGVTLSELQKSVIVRETGSVDAPMQLFTQGWFMYVGDATPETRTARGPFPAKFYYTDGGSVQSINMTSTAVL
jgi:hypothetical protein